MYKTFWSQFTLSLSYLLILKIKIFKSSCYVSLTLLICQTQITLYANAQRAKETREIKLINFPKKIYLKYFPWKIKLQQEKISEIDSFHFTILKNS